MTKDPEFEQLKRSMPELPEFSVISHVSHSPKQICQRCDHSRNCPKKGNKRCNEWQRLKREMS